MKDILMLIFNQRPIFIQIIAIKLYTLLLLLFDADADYNYKNKTKTIMVSTRCPKSTFSENERVLCYEPDLTKAKVLYDSKVGLGEFLVTTIKTELSLRTAFFT